MLVLAQAAQACVTHRPSDVRHRSSRSHPYPSFRRSYPPTTLHPSTYLTRHHQNGHYQQHPPPPSYPIKSQPSSDPDFSMASSSSPPPSPPPASLLVPTIIPAITPTVSSRSHHSSSSSSSSSQLPRHRRSAFIPLWDVDDVASWLSEFKFGEDYVESFRRSGVNGRVLTTLNQEQLTKKLGVKMVHALRLTSEIQREVCRMSEHKIEQMVQPADLHKEEESRGAPSKAPAMAAVLVPSVSRRIHSSRNRNRRNGSSSNSALYRQQQQQHYSQQPPRFLARAALLKREQREEDENGLKTDPDDPTYEFRAFECRYCVAIFRDKEDHDEHHQKEHSGDLKFWCRWKNCGMRFEKRKLFLEHSRTHSEMKPHNCPQCGKCFSRRNNLFRHMRTHLGIRPFQCNVGGCHKQFSTKSNLQTHKKTHSKQSQFRCDYCERIFVRPAYYHKHVLQKHGGKWNSVRNAVLAMKELSYSGGGHRLQQHVGDSPYVPPPEMPKGSESEVVEMSE